MLVPIAIVIAVFAFVLGFTALACRIGEWIEDRLGWQPGNAFVATAIGFVVLLAPTLIARFVDVAPVGAAPLTFVLVAIGLTVEFIAWTIGSGRGDHHRPGPLVYGAAADHRARRRADAPARARASTLLVCYC